MTPCIRLLVLGLLFSPCWFCTAAFSLEIPPSWTIRQAVAYALANSPDAGQARQRIDAAASRIDEARSAFYPRLLLGAEYSQTTNPMYSFGNILNQEAFHPQINFNDPGRTDNLNIQGGIRYRFYNGGQDRAGVDAAVAGEEASKAELAVVHAQLAFHVVKAFHTIVQTRETVQARESALQAIQASVNVAQARYDAGDLLQTDLLNLEVQLSQAKEQLIQAKHHYNLAQRGFLNLLGLEQGEAAIVCDGAGQEPPVNEESSRPELRAMEARIRALEAALRQAEGGHYPSIDGFAGVQADRGFETEGEGDSWNAGVKLNYELFNGHRTRASVAAAQAELKAAREQQRKIRLAIDLENAQARLALTEAEQRLQVTGTMVAQAQESARLSRERFKEGVILASEVIDVENRLTEAMVRDALARGDKSIAVADLRRAQGLAQFEEPAGRDENTEGTEK